MIDSPTIKNTENKPMTDEHRPDPDALLAAIQERTSQQQHGKLKIFLGMSPGVGKTYAMLESAKQRKIEGIDVVIAYIETHGRAETEALLAGLELLPRKKIEYHGTTLEEMDLEAALARKPQLALVDELAHDDAPGSSHTRRYQDVLELLAAGIDVYTTLNVQHLESRVHDVEQITGIRVERVVPDMMIDIASEIELIDLPPDELLKRLQEGKVYAEHKVADAANNFFRPGNLAALREMALRLTAERVDQQLSDYMQLKAIPGPWKSSERLMVAISPSPTSARLIRWTRRMAYNMTAPWLAIYVESPTPLSAKAQEQLKQNLNRVYALGGEVVTLVGTNVAQAILQSARQRNVTQIVVGKPERTRWQEWLSGGSLVDRVIRASGEIDVYVISGDTEDMAARPSIPHPEIHSPLNQYILSSLVVAAAVIGNLLLLPLIGYQAVGLVLLTVVVFMGYFFGRGPILLAAIVSALLWDYLFIPPRFTFNIFETQDWITFLLYFVVAVVLGTITAQRNGQEKLLRQREANATALYTMTRDTSQAISLDDALRAVVKEIGQVFNARVAIALKGPDGTLSETPHPASTLAMDDREWSAANWAFERKQVAGRFSETLPTAVGRYWPLNVTGDVVGALGVQLDTPLQPEQESLIQTFAGHAALVIERESLETRAQQAALAQESERLYATLLDSVSHELRTPLTAITGAAAGLLDPAVQRNSDKQQALGTEIQTAAQRLNRLVDNLLDMSRIESGRMALHLEWCDVHDLIDVSVKQVASELADHDLVLDLAPNLPLVRMDFALMEQVLVNLLHNAAMYTPPGVRVRVTASTEDSELVLSVADRGPGLPPADMERVFQKFYRAPGAKAGGTGLGLSICKGFVEAHGGTIAAENRPTRGGARFIIRLPIGGAPEVPQEIGV